MYNLVQCIARLHQMFQMQMEEGQERQFRKASRRWRCSHLKLELLSDAVYNLGQCIARLHQMFQMQMEEGQERQFRKASRRWRCSHRKLEHWCDVV